MRKISLGTAQLGSAYGVANRGGIPSAGTVDEILDRALSAGIRYLDTAPVYGEAEKRIGRFLRERGAGDSFEICTKLSALDEGLSSSELAKAVDLSLESSLRKLAVPVLSEVLVHHIEQLHRHGRALIDALLRSRERGWLGKIGVSVYGPEDLSVLDEFPELEIVQHPLSIFDQRLLNSECLTDLQSKGCIVQARSVFLQGLVSLSEDALPQGLAHARHALREYLTLLADSELTAVEAALLFVTRSEVDRVIVGMETAAQLKANVDTMSKSMPDELFQQLRTKLRNLPVEIMDPRRWPGRVAES